MKADVALRPGARILRLLAIFSGTRTVTILCGIIRAKIVALCIGPVGVGLLGIFNSALDLVGTATRLSLRDSTVRDLASARDDATHAARVTTSVRRWGRVLGLFGALVMVALSPLLSRFSFGDYGRWWQFALLGLALLIMASSDAVTAILQGLGHYRRLARAMVWGAVAGVVVSAPLYIFLGERGIIPSLILFAVCEWVALRLCRPQLPQVTEPVAESLRRGRSFMRLGVYMTLSAAFNMAATYIFLSYLNRVADTDAAGLYQAGTMLFNRYSGIIFAAMGVEFYPRLAAAMRSPRRVAVYVNHQTVLLQWLALPMSVAFIAVAPWVVTLLYSDAFLPIVPMVALGIVGTVLRGASWVVGLTMTARGDGRVYVITEGASALLYVVLNIAGWHVAGLTGLGVAYIVWYVLYLTMVKVVYRRRYGLRLSRAATLLPWGVAAVAMMAVLLLLTPGLALLNIALLGVVLVASWRRLRRLLVR